MVTSRHLNLFGRAHDVGRGHFFEHVMSTPVSSMRRFQLSLENQWTYIENTLHVQKI
jgi:hypothetical protein